MTNKLCYVLLLLSLSVSFGQIKVNNKKTLMVIFPTQIVKASVGSSDFLVQFNPDGSQKYCFIKCTLNAPESNLIVETADGYLYNLTLLFSKLAENSYMVNLTEGIDVGGNGGSEGQGGSNTAPVPTPPNKNNTPGKSNNNGSNSSGSNIKKNLKENDYTIGNTVINDAYTKVSNCDICDGLLKKGKKIKRITKVAFDIKLDLESVFYANEKIYITVNLYNQSSIDYKINYIKTYIQQGKESTTSSAQYLEINPVQIFNSNRIIEHDSNKKFIFIYNQFTIDENKNLIFELNEANGERNIKLTIPNYIINEPEYIK